MNWPDWSSSLLPPVRKSSPSGQQYFSSSLFMSPLHKNIYSDCQFGVSGDEN